MSKITYRQVRIGEHEIEFEEEQPEVSLADRLRAHASIHDDSTSPYDDEQALWAKDLREAADAIEHSNRHLGDLLAVIHRDGGNYQAEHGTAKAVEDAIEKVAHLLAAGDDAP